MNMVKKAFGRLDVNGTGSITINDCTGIYDVSMNPDFLEGRKTREEIFHEFISSFEGPHGNNDGTVTF